MRDDADGRSARAWRWALLLASLGAAGGSTRAPSARRVAVPSRRLRAESDALVRSDVLIIDGDNVRGKTNFRWTAEQLAELTAAWARTASLPGRVLLFFDHGAQPDALWDSSGLCIAFAGPSCSADDQIVDAVRFLSREHRAVVTVATADSELRDRCSKATLCRRHLQTVAPVSLIGALQVVLDGRALDDELDAGDDAGDGDGDGDGDEVELALELEAGAQPSREQQRVRQVSAELSSIGQQLRLGCARNKRRKLLERKLKCEALRWELVAAESAAVRAGLAGAVAGAPVPSARASPAAPPPSPALPQRELTADRVLRAETVRRALLAAGASLTPPAGLAVQPALAAYLTHAFARPGVERPTAAAAERDGGGARPPRAATDGAPLGPGARLLALDVGQRVGGFAIVDAQSGALLRLGGLQTAAPHDGDLLETLPRVLDALRAAGGRLERVVLEGNSQMTGAWRAALCAQLGVTDGSLAAPPARSAARDDSVATPRAIDILSVSAQTWRAHMLTAREQKDKLAAKEAARRIAKQLLARSGMPADAGRRLDTNVAEAVCVAHWACEYLWRPSDSSSEADAAAPVGRATLSWPWLLVRRTIAGEILP